MWKPIFRLIFMTKSREVITLSAILGLFLVLPVLAKEPAEESLILKLVDEELVQLEDLGIENPGILQSNPFYFVKKFRRSTLRVFRFNSVRRAEFELGVLNEKAAELKRLDEVVPEKNESFVRASDAYLESLDRLQTLLLDIKDNRDDPEVSGLLNKLADIGIKHVKMFDQLKPEDDLRTKVRLVFLQERMSEVLISAFDRLDKPEKVRQRILQTIESQRGGAFKEFRSAEVLDRIQEKASPSSSISADLLWLKEELFLKTQVNIRLRNLESTLPAVMERLPGDDWVRVKVLDEGREYLTDSGLRSDFGSIRQLILDLSASSRNIGKLEAGKAIESANQIIGLLEEKIEESVFRSQSARTLLAKAEFNFERAADAFGSGQYIASFGQGSVALAAARSALNQLTQIDGFEGEIRWHKAAYDFLVEEYLRNEITEEENPEFFEVLSAAEISLIKASDLAAQESRGDEALSELKKARVNILEARLILNDLLLQFEERERAERASQPLIQRVLQ